MNLRGQLPRQQQRQVGARLHHAGLADLEDLVTLLWDAELTHVGIEYVATDGDAESGASGSEDGATVVIAPWPAAGSG